MPSESLEFNILARDQASSSFRHVGDAAVGASAKMDLAAASLKLWNDTAQKQGKAATSSINAMQAHTKAANLLADAENVLAGRATTTTKLMADQGTEFDKTAQKAGGAAAGLAGVAGTGGAGGGAAAGGGMAAVIAAGVALSPVLITVGFGLAGLGAAAYGIAKPILTAAQATGGLQANMASLNPEQQKVATGLLGLQRQFGAFEKVLQPAVFVLFNQGIRLAGTLLHDLEPVAAATGKALGGVLAAVNKEFSGSTWQSFFAFMARTAGPDVRLLGTTFVDLLDTLPPLVQGLQPVAVGLLKVVDAGIKVTDVFTHAPGLFGDTTDALIQLQNHQVGTARSTDTMGVAINQAALRTQGLGSIVSIADETVHGAGAAFKFLTGQVGPSAKALSSVATPAQRAAKNLQGVATATKNLMTAQQAALTTATTYAGDILTTANDGIALEKALDKSRNKIGLHTAAQRASFGAANTYITDLGNQASAAVASGHGTDAAIRAIRNGLPILDSAKTKSHAYWAEVQILVNWLHQLEQQKQAAFNAKITGQGTWNVQGLPGSLSAHIHGAGAAAGLFINRGTTPTADDVMVRASKGELIVPTHMVNGGAVDHLRGKIPGFAGGGIAGYNGPIAGLQPWGHAAWKQALTTVVSDVAASEAHTFSAALQAARHAARAAVLGAGTPGPGGGSPAANAALARRLFPQWAGEPYWGAWNYVAMAESGWNQFARNPSSGAYGIPQALPPSKMGAAANPPQSNPAAQIRWMAGYMSSRYGGPVGAAQHEAAYHNYDRGGYLPPGVTMAVNATGRNERVLGPGEGTRLQIEWVGGNAGDGLLQWIQKNVRIRGGGNVQKAFGRP